jgi:hypothetical protein
MDKWKTKSGETMFIQEMTTNHLKNATNMMARNQSAIAESLMQSFIKFAGTLTGDMATMHADAIIDAFYEDEYEDPDFNILTYPPMMAMLEELKNRGVDHDPL